MDAADAVGAVSAAAMITVSANEVLRISEWVLRASGMSCGNEDDPARAVTWLALRFDGVLDAWLRELDAVSPGMAPWLEPATSQRPWPRLHAGGASALLVAPAVLDWLRAQPPRESPSIEVCAVRASPWWLAHLSIAPGAFCAQAHVVDRDGGSRAFIQRGANGTVHARFEPSIRECFARLHDVKLTRVCTLAASNGVGAISSTSLKARADDALRHGLGVPRHLWETLQGKAYAAYVPASAASRHRGAGGGDDNE